MEGAFLAHHVQAYEVERAQRNIAKIRSPRGPAQSEQRDGRFGVPRRELLAIHGWRLSAPPFAKRQSVIGGIGGLAAIKAARGRVVECSEQVRDRTIRGLPVPRVTGHPVSLAQHGRQCCVEMHQLLVMRLAPLPPFGETKEAAIDRVIEGSEDPVESLLDGDEVATIPSGLV